MVRGSARRGFAFAGSVQTHRERKRSSSDCSCSAVAGEEKLLLVIAFRVFQPPFDDDAVLHDDPGPSGKKTAQVIGAGSHSNFRLRSRPLGRSVRGRVGYLSLFCSLTSVKTLSVPHERCRILPACGGPLHKFSSAPSCFTSRWLSQSC